MNTVRLVKGEIFFDDFNETSLNEKWAIVPEDLLRFSLIEYPGFLRLYHGSPDLHILINEPDEYVLDIKNDYIPVNSSDQSGIVVFRELSENLEILEFRDTNKDESFVYPYIRLIKTGRLYTIYGRNSLTDLWELVASTTFEGAGKVGLICKGPQETDSVHFNVDYVKMYKNQEVKLLNVPQGHRVDLCLESNQSVIFSRKVASPYSGVSLMLLEIPNIRAYFNILDQNSTIIHTSAVFDMCGGDIYYYGATLNVFVNGLNMKNDEEYFLGYYQDSEIPFTITLKNPYDAEFQGVRIEAVQYDSDALGYTLVRFSLDGEIFDTSAGIGIVAPFEEITLYGKIVRDADIISSDIIPYKFNLKVTTI